MKLQTSFYGKLNRLEDAQIFKRDNETSQARHASNLWNVYIFNSFAFVDDVSNDLQELWSINDAVKLINTKGISESREEIGETILEIYDFSFYDPEKLNIRIGESI